MSNSLIDLTEREKSYPRRASTKGAKAKRVIHEGPRSTTKGHQGVGEDSRGVCRGSGRRKLKRIINIDAQDAQDAQDLVSPTERMTIIPGIVVIAKFLVSNLIAFL